MAYNDDAVLAKLSALNETQESIVTVAQWVMFHRYVQNIHYYGNKLSLSTPTLCTVLTRCFIGDTQIELDSCGCRDLKTLVATKD